MNWITKQEETFDKYRFSYMSVMIMALATLGSIAAYISIFHHNWFFVSITTFAAMGSLAMFIAQAKAKICIIGFYISIAISALVLIANIFLYYI